MKPRKNTTQAVLAGLQKQLKADPKNSELALNVAESALRIGESAEALAHYKRAIELDPRIDLRCTYYQWLGLYSETRGQLDEALEAYRKWSELEPMALEPLDRQSRLLVKLARWTDLFLLRPLYLRMAEPGVPRARESLALYSFLTLQLGRNDDVSTQDRTYAALEQDSQSISMRYLLGILLYRAGQVEAAEKEFERVLELDTQERWREFRFGLDWDASGARLMLARLARMRGNQGLALELLHSVGARGFGAEGLDDMATLLLDNARYTELLELLGQPEEGQEVPDWVDRCRAVSYLGLGRLAEAEKLFADSRRKPPAKGALSSGEELPAPLAKLLSEGQFEELLKKLKKSRTNGSPALWAQAQALIGLERWAQARVTLESLLNERPESLPAWDLLATACRRLGHQEGAQLATIQAETLRQREAPALARGFLWPSGADSPLPGLRFQASSGPGKASLRVTGHASRSVEELARYALTLVQPLCEVYSLEDPSYREIHLHVGGLGRSSRDRRAEELRVDEEAGAAIFCALVQALAGPHLSPPCWVVYGRLELDGRLRGPVDLGGSLRSVQSPTALWERLVIPTTAAPELLDLPAAWWLGMPVVFCDDVEQLIESLMSLRVAPERTRR